MIDRTLVWNQKDYDKHIIVYGIEQDKNGKDLYKYSYKGNQVFHSPFINEKCEYFILDLEGNPISNPRIKVEEPLTP